MARNKASVMEALLKIAELEVPKALVAGEVERMIERRPCRPEEARREGRGNGADPARVFQPQAERRVRLGLVVGELVRANSLQAKPRPVAGALEEMAQSYEKPAEVVRWYLGDRQRMAEVEAMVVENNVAEHRARARAQGRSTRPSRSTS